MSLNEDQILWLLILFALVLGFLEGMFLGWAALGGSVGAGLFTIYRMRDK